MSALTALNLTFGYIDRILFSNVDFKIENTDRVGLIGANGTGKTTLFKLITGELSPDEGGIVRGRDIKLGYMEQYISGDSHQSVYEDALTVFSDVEEMETELSSIHDRLESGETDITLIERQLYLTEEIERRDGLVYRAKTRSALLALGFSEEDLQKSVTLLSGGQRGKLSLCKLLLSNSSIILLDEPTNHLDIDSVAWLEDFLSKYKGGAVIISHDRYFLDRVTNRTFEISNNKVYSSDFSYSNHKKLMEERQLSIERDYDKSMKEVERIEGIIEQQKRFNQERNYITIASKEKQIERIKADIVVPDREQRSVRISFKASVQSGNDVLYAEGLSKSFGSNRLFSNVGFDIKRNERIFILGPNGCGKSTLLKIIMKEYTPDTGSVRRGVNVRPGYFDQNISHLTDTNTVEAEIWDAFRAMTPTEVRSSLAAFLFRGDDVYKKISELSGGERARVALLKLILAKPNLLILDEPTNHLDIASREVLEDALLDYDGTILAVSHDRYLINKLASGIIVLSQDGGVSLPGNYDAYLGYKASLPEEVIKRGHTKNEYQIRKERESEERRRQGKIKRLESDIEAAESEKAELEQTLSKPEVASDYIKTIELSGRHDELTEKLNELYALWEELSQE